MGITFSRCLIKSLSGPNCTHSNLKSPGRHATCIQAGVLTQVGISSCEELTFLKRCFVLLQTEQTPTMCTRICKLHLISHSSLTLLQAENFSLKEKWLSKNSRIGTNPDTELTYWHCILHSSFFVLYETWYYSRLTVSWMMDGMTSDKSPNDIPLGWILTSFVCCRTKTYNDNLWIRLSWTLMITYMTQELKTPTEFQLNSSEKQCIKQEMISPGLFYQVNTSENLEIRQAGGTSSERTLTLMYL